MILTGERIEREVRRGRIEIDPFDRRQLNPNSYNYRLGSLLRVPMHGLQDADKPVPFLDIRVPKEGLVLQPAQLYLGHTVERIGSGHFVTSLIGRSSLGRLGVYLQVSADLAQLGNVHAWTLELMVVQPIRVYPGMRIGQVSFWKPSGRRTEYEGRYRGTDLPTRSRIERTARRRSR
jgi:dCTP deaminase